VPENYHPGIELNGSVNTYDSDTDAAAYGGDEL